MDETSGSARGRPRSEASRDAIIAAAGNLLRTVGLKNMTIEAVAAASGVGKATIYRWWPSKGSLALDAYQDDMHSKVDLPDTDDSREDLLLHVRAVIDFYGGEEGRILAQLIAEAQSDPLVAEAFRERFLSQRRATVTEIWRRGVARGEFRDDVDPAIAMDMIFAPIVYRLVAGHAPLTAALAEPLVDAALRGLEAPGAKAAACKAR